MDVPIWPSTCEGVQVEARLFVVFLLNLALALLLKTHLLKLLKVPTRHLDDNIVDCRLPAGGGGLGH